VTLRKGEITLLEIKRKWTHHVALATDKVRGVKNSQIPGALQGTLRATTIYFLSTGNLTTIWFFAFPQEVGPALRRKHHGNAKRPHLPMARPCVAQSALRSLQGRPLDWTHRGPWKRHRPPRRSHRDGMVPRLLAARDRAILFMAKRLIFVKSDGTPCTTRSGERANSGAPPVLVAFGFGNSLRRTVERWSRAGSCSGRLRSSTKPPNEYRAGRTDKPRNTK
jgi:hypothetical protein